MTMYIYKLLKILLVYVLKAQFYPLPPEESTYAIPNIAMITEEPIRRSIAGKAEMAVIRRFYIAGWTF